MKTCMRTKLLLIFSVGLCIGLIGCQQGFNLTKPAIDSDFIRSYQVQNIAKPLPIVLNNMGSSELFESFSEKLRQTGLYSHVYKTPPIGNHIFSWLVIDKAPSISITKALLMVPTIIIYAGSFSLLAPLLPIQTSFDYKYTLNVRWPNKINKVYSAECAAEASINMPTYGDKTHLSRILVMKEGAAELASNSCLKSLVNQLSFDYGSMTKGYADIEPIPQQVIDYQSPISPVKPTQTSPPTISKKKANVEPKQQIGELE